MENLRGFPPKILLVQMLHSSPGIDGYRMLQVSTINLDVFYVVFSVMLLGCSVLCNYVGMLSVVNYCSWVNVGNVAMTTVL